MDLASARAEISNPPVLRVAQILVEIAVFLAIAGLIVVLMY